MPDIADTDIEAYKLYCQLTDAMNIAGPTAFPNDFSKLAPRDAQTDQKIVAIINKAFAAQAIRTMDEVNTDIVMVERKKNVQAERWQEVTNCEKITDALAVRKKAIKKEAGL